MIICGCEAKLSHELTEQGTVKLTPQGEVRWTTWSIFHGEERWRSEGIQIGGPQSERGVLGFWFDKYVFPYNLFPWSPFIHFPFPHSFIHSL